MTYRLASLAAARVRRRVRRASSLISETAYSMSRIVSAQENGGRSRIQASTSATVGSGERVDIRAAPAVEGSDAATSAEVFQLRKVGIEETVVEPLLLLQRRLGAWSRSARGKDRIFRQPR